MRSSEQLDELADALSQAQAKFPMVPKLHKAEIPMKSGGKYSYDYADMGDTVEAVKPVIAEFGLSVVQTPGFHKGTDVLTTRLLHKSGQWIEDTMRLFLSQESPQVHGSAITYGRRYAYCAILGIVADKDDDGALAQLAYGESSTRTTRRKAPKASTPVAGARSAPATDPATDGKTAMLAKDRNKILVHFNSLNPPVRDPIAVLGRVNSLLEGDGPVEALVKLTKEQGEKIFSLLGIEA